MNQKIESSCELGRRNGRVGEEAQAVIAERHVLSTDEHGFKSQLDHVLNDLEYDIKA